MCVLTLFSCEKNDDQKSELNNSQNRSSSISLEDNRIVFNTVEDYENIMQDAFDTGAVPEILSGIKTELKSCSLSEDDNYDDFLLTILNSDNVVQIGEWLYKVDMENKQVSVLNSKYPELYTELLNNIENELIYNYSTDDDVIDLVENGVFGDTQLKSTKGWFCKAGKAASYTKTTWIDDFDMEFKLHYTRAGIYFALYAKVKESSSPFHKPISGAGVVNLEYIIKARCKDFNRGPRSFEFYFTKDGLIAESKKYYMYRRTRQAEYYGVLLKAKARRGAGKYLSEWKNPSPARIVIRSNY